MENSARVRESEERPRAAIVQVLEYEKPTPNTIRFQAVGDPAERAAAAISTLYVRKETLADPAPRRIRVTVEVLDG